MTTARWLRLVDWAPVVHRSTRRYFKGPRKKRGQCLLADHKRCLEPHVGDDETTHSPSTYLVPGRQVPRTINLLHLCTKLKKFPFEFLSSEAFRQYLLKIELLFQTSRRRQRRHQHGFGSSCVRLQGRAEEDVEYSQDPLKRLHDAYIQAYTRLLMPFVWIFTHKISDVTRTQEADLDGAGVCILKQQ